MKAKVAERGQVTIPQKLRLKLGIRPGTVLDFNIQNGKLVAVKTDTNDPVAQVYGCLGKKFFNTDEFIHEIRGGDD